MTDAATLVAAAKMTLRNLGPEDVAARLAESDVLLADVREPDETARGVIPGAVLAPRGMLEFYADPTSPHHRQEFRPDRPTILYCAAGSRSALAAQTLRRLGYHDVAHLEGGFAAWTAEGRPTAVPTPGR